MPSPHRLSRLAAPTLAILCAAAPELAHAAKTSTIAAGFTNFDLDGDTVAEINALTPLSFEDDGDLPADAKIVVVLVEQRLLDMNVGGGRHGAAALRERLRRLRGRLHAEGYAPRFFGASVYDGPKHQDGRTVLALRRFLKSMRDAFGQTQGAILIGSFPEAMLVRRWVWRRQAWEVTIDGVKYNCDGCPQRDFLRIVPELVAHRADLVLADLDGNWESLYVQPEREIEAIEALPGAGVASNWPVNGAVFTSRAYNRTKMKFQDYFFIQDDRYQVNSDDGTTLRLQTWNAMQGPELSAADRTRPNPMARPELFVSRVNARNVAVLPDPMWRDKNGKQMLDPLGRPQVVSTTRAINPSALRVRSAAHERDLLIEYLDRDDAFRVGGNPTEARRTAAVNFGAGLVDAAGANNYLAPAATGFAPAAAFKDASLVEYIDFLAAPAALKAISVHSSPYNDSFGELSSPAALAARAGGKPWRWKQSGSGSNYTYTPSFDDQKGTADVLLYQTLHASGALAEAGGSIYIHSGCEANSPRDAAAYSYNELDYASRTGFQNAEGLLFYSNAVAVAARAKVFYDRPDGLPAALATGHLGDGWRAYFDRESANAGLAADPAGAKRAYTWSVLGDWTLKLRSDNGLGLIGARGHVTQAVAVHRDGARIGGWNFSTAADTIRGAGKFDGGAREQLVVTSGWGIGVLGWDGAEWVAALGRPWGTRFGGWNSGAADQIRAIADFDGDGRDELLVTSGWGIGILGKAGGTFASETMAPVATRFGGWNYGKADTIVGTGDFDGDGKADIVIRSGWGLGVLSLGPSGLVARTARPYGTSVGGWNLGAADVIEGIGDLDGDGKAELVIRSGWGIAVLELVGDALTPLVIKPKDTLFGGWRYDPAQTRVRAIADFDGDGREDLVVTSPWGIGILEVNGSTMTTLAAGSHDTWFDAWRYSTQDVVVAAADLSGDGQAELVLRSGWGTGVLRLVGDALKIVSGHPHGTRVGAWHMNPAIRLGAVADFDGAPGQELLFEAR